ncbi:MAG: hypothetical protein V1845_01985 [bacterium]
MKNFHSLSIKKPTCEELRAKHPLFIYESFALEESDNSLKIKFQFLLKPDIYFRPEITFESFDRPKVNLLDRAILENLAFHLGLIEMLSYWKAACSPQIILKAGSLDSQQITWWKDMLLHGMREFFYMNDIDFTRSDFVNISVQDDRGLVGRRYDDHPPQDSLVLVSGGKDSAFTLQFLKEIGKGFNCLLLNPTQAATALSLKAGCREPIVVKRTIDPKLLLLNNAGYLNGHTPFSALLAFLGVTCAALFGYENVIVSNERSCDEGNVSFLDNEVNHQYSKTFRFENKFRDYVQKYLAKNVNYFSLLRPLYEIQITHLFAGYPQYFDIFKSCNRNQAENTWCKHCPKCLFIFTMLYPFLQSDDLTRIFEEDLFMHDNSIPVIQELIGINCHKPFECVGTVEETLVGFYLGIKKVQSSENKLPSVLRYVKQDVLPKYPNIEKTAGKMLSAWSDQHNLPQRYAELLRNRVVEPSESR